MPGYAILDVDRETFDQDVICECCGSVVRDARSAVCGHFFCSSCVENRFRKNKGGVSYCPETRIPLFYFQFFPADEAFCDRVDNLTVHCLFFNSGCDWTGKLQNFEDHVLVCEFAAGDHDGKEIMGKCEVNHDMAVDMHGGQMGAKQKTDSSILTAPQDGFVASGVNSDFVDPAYDAQIKDPYELPKKNPSWREADQLAIITRMTEELNQDHVLVGEFAAGDHDGKEIMGKCEVNHDMAVDMHGGQMGAKQKTDSSVLTAPQDGFVASGMNSDFVDPAYDTQIEDPYELPKKCKFCKEPVELNAMERHCDVCPAWPVKLGKCGKEEVHQSKKEQLNSTLPLSRKLLPSSDEVDEKDKIALPLKEICGGNSDARSMSPCPSLELPITDQHEQRLNDLENKVAQLNSVLTENRQLKQVVSYLTNELHRVHSKVGYLEQALPHIHNKVDYLQQTFQANLRAVHDEIVNVQVQMSAFMISPFPQEERARLMESIQGIQQRIGRLEQHVQSYGNMIGAMSTSLTRVANAVERDRIPAVDIRRL